jgi:hypothetical protein
MAAMYLEIYLNDQLALGVAFRELARRAARENAGSDLGAALDRVATAIGQDIATFELIMDRLGVQRSRAKPLAAIAAERAGRLKPNGSIRGYSPLSRFTELDFLTMAIASKKQLWANLRDFAALSDRMPDVDFGELIARAERQLSELEPFRAESGRDVLRR